MWYEVLKFEINYRLKRPETYLFFIFLLAFSIFGVDFIFEGVALGLVKKNAPIVIGKTMGAITGIFMILASMVMGMSMIRDDQYEITDLIYTIPIGKLELLSGRFLGSFLILLLIFCGVPIGMMLGELLPWQLDSEMLPFRLASYATSFLIIVVPILFFGASLFFVTGTLSRKLLVVYTQGIIFFVFFLMTKSITDEYWQAILDPFSLSTITQLSKDWTVAEKNNLLLPFKGVFMVNKIIWIASGILVLWVGYWKFNFSTLKKSSKPSKSRVQLEPNNRNIEVSIPIALPGYDWRSVFHQFIEMSIFYCKSVLRETSFWAIVICGVIIIFVNSISLGTVYGVDSHPTTYFIIEELQELSLYFFIIILLFYSAELHWKEHGAGLNLMSDATPISSLITLGSKMTGLIGVYIVLICALILSGISFQLLEGYYHFDLPVYCSGFFIEILPFLIIYTFAAFFIQSLFNNKFIGILITLIFFIVVAALGSLGFDHVLLYFGGDGLKAYSEMNGYGHFISPYLWGKLYWVLFGSLTMILASLITNRGVSKSILNRLKNIRSSGSRRIRLLSFGLFTIFVLVGGFIFYQTNVLNEVWTEQEQEIYRANYERKLKRFEYKPQPTITRTNLHLELYPDQRAYDVIGEYTLKNEDSSSINEVHIQKLIESDVSLNDVQFSVPVIVDSQYQTFECIVYRFTTPLAPGDSINMRFQQALKPGGFSTDGSVGSVLYNGTFIRNNEFPTIGYNRKYELRDALVRESYGLDPRPVKANIDDVNELRLARSGSDAHGVRTNVIIGTKNDQTAITSGNMVRKWKENNRNYFEYYTAEPMINFYSILSGRYELLKDHWVSKCQEDQDTVDLEIYYHKRHNYNLDRMMKSMKASLDYYSTNFSAYQYEQLRIVEFPRYEQFAQSFPNTIPFAESIGFMLDIDDATDVDMTFFVTAHEVAHQWWGMQVEAANVRGGNFILETLSQYSALMVFKNQFSQTKVNQFLDLQRDLYKEGKQKAKKKEVPLHLVEDEEYIYYNKGAIVMYELQDCIGEENINKALGEFIRDWHSQSGTVKGKTDRYATSEDLISYIMQATPEKDRIEVENLFKGI